jgi:hypothetical protein
MRPYVAAAVFLALALGAPARGKALAVDLTRGPYVQSAAHDAVTIVWTTAAPSAGAVEYGADAGLGSRRDDAAIATTHAVTLDRLEPATRYFYRILAGGETLAEGLSFDTYPDPGSAPGAFRFAVFGDSGSGSQAQRDIAARLAAEEPAFVLHLGDLLYPEGAGMDFDAKYFEVYGDLIARATVWPTLGNKDVEDGGAGYLETFHLPAGGPAGERYYAFVHGSALFVCLDLNAVLSPAGAQHAWLLETLRGATTLWKVVYLHHPGLQLGDPRPRAPRPSRAALRRVRRRPRSPGPHALLRAQLPHPRRRGRRPRFHRGDPDDDGAMRVTDAVFLLSHLFQAGLAPSCREAADANNDGRLDVSDAVYALLAVFAGGAPPPAPGPPGEPCGPDTDPAQGAGDLGCERYGSCF